LLEKLHRAKVSGFQAAKLEICINGPYGHNGLRERRVTFAATGWNGRSGDKTRGVE
jgi:hypothetical protein